MKALTLFDYLKEEEGSSAESEAFVASRGWFERFKNRFKLRSIIITGESVSADKEAAAAYPG